MKKALIASVSHTGETIKELRADRQFAVAYLKAAPTDGEVLVEVPRTQPIAYRLTQETQAAREGQFS